MPKTLCKVLLLLHTAAASSAKSTTLLDLKESFIGRSIMFDGPDQLNHQILPHLFAGRHSVR
jgi:hypothetical protein